MSKEFFTERDIEDLFKRGVMSLSIGDDTVLTELAYEKANRLGMQLLRGQAENPPCAPVRPYLTQKPMRTEAKTAVPVAEPPPGPDLHGRIREAVLARLGGQVDPAMLDIIISRVLKNTGVK